MQRAHSVVPVLAVIVGIVGVSFGEAGCSQGSAKTAPEVRALTKFSNDGKAFVEDVRSARVAIFDGDPKTAKDLLIAAKTSLQAAKKDAPSFNVKTTTSVRGKTVDVEQATTPATMVPFDGQMVIDDDYVLTPEKQAHINKANEHLKKGEAKEAAEELRLAQIDVNFNRMWIPIAASERHLDDAIKLANDDKYYEANLALKAIVDGITMDSVSLASSPK